MYQCKRHFEWLNYTIFITSVLKQESQLIFWISKCLRRYGCTYLQTTDTCTALWEVTWLIGACVCHYMIWVLLFKLKSKSKHKCQLCSNQVLQTELKTLYSNTVRMNTCNARNWIFVLLYFVLLQIEYYITWSREWLQV